MFLMPLQSPRYPPCPYSFGKHYLGWSSRLWPSGFWEASLSFLMHRSTRAHRGEIIYIRIILTGIAGSKDNLALQLTSTTLRSGSGFFSGSGHQA